MAIPENTARDRISEHATLMLTLAARAGASHPREFATHLADADGHARAILADDARDALDYTLVSSWRPTLAEVSGLTAFLRVGDPHVETVYGGAAGEQYERVVQAIEEWRS